ncbi:hypothetical protein CK203_110305 [Vitis vinifera]|uniref:Uncharacterized protein n=1 Tax=Vitis vinifera TaxID=29760 RepID=A0A438DGA3_VITVI|nr:hypothetical protein CK203_110305 [Vitis vinifera]
MSRISNPPKKKVRVSKPELIDLSEPSSEPPSEPQSSQPPPTESQIPSSMTPEPLSDFSPSSGTPSICYRGPRSYCYPLHHRPDVMRRGVLLEALFRISEGFFFGPHHLIMAALLYFEEKVHRKKLLKANAYSTSLPRLLSYSADQGAPAGAEHPDIPHPEQSEEPQPVEIPADMRSTCPCSALYRAYTRGCTLCSSCHTIDSPVIPATSEPSLSSEPRIAISISEYKGLCHTLQALTTSQSILAQEMTTLRAHQEQIFATQT